MEAAVATGNSEEGGRGEIAAKIAHMEEIYEFSAPRFFDFLNQETEDQIRNAEIWFERGLSYAQSREFSLLFLSRNLLFDFVR